MKSVKGSELKGLSVDQRVTKILEVSKAVFDAPNGEITSLGVKIAAYEKLYGVDSSRMKAELSSGERVETNEICDWLMLLDLRDRIAARNKARPG